MSTRLLNVLVDKSRGIILSILSLALSGYPGQLISAPEEIGYTASVADRAMALPDMDFTSPQQQAIAAGLHYLSLIAFLDPDAASSDKKLFVDRIVQHLTNVVQAGKEPDLRGIQTAWADQHVGAAIALAKYTPGIWDQLSDFTKERLDWIMKIGTYTGNIQHNANNFCYLDINMENGGNYNPNQRNAMVAWMSYAYIYFGGASNVNQMLSEFDYDLMMGKLGEYGWSTTIEAMSGDDTERLLKEGGSAAKGNCTVNPEGVRKAFTFSGRVVSGNPACPDWSQVGSEVEYEPFNLLKREEYEFNLAAEVVDRACEVAVSCGTEGHIPEGFASPHLGEIGMFLEYNINGRSSADYVVWGAKSALYHYYTLLVAGFWKSSDPDYQNVASRYDTAVDVWRYRLEFGWYDTAHCEYRSGIGTYSGTDFALDLWDALVSSDISWAYDPVVEVSSNGPIPPPPVPRVMEKG